MPEQPPEKRGSVAPFLIAMAICVAGVILSLGLCGMGSRLHPGSGLGRGSPLTGLGAVLFVIGLLGFLGSILALVIQLIYNAFRRD